MTRIRLICSHAYRKQCKRSLDDCLHKFAHDSDEEGECSPDAFWAPPCDAYPHKTCVPINSPLGKAALKRHDAQRPPIIFPKFDAKMVFSISQLPADEGTRAWAELCQRLELDAQNRLINSLEGPSGPEKSD